MSDIQKELERQQMSINRPIAGSSLTNDPENPQPFEKPPQFTDLHEASEYLWVKMINEVTYVGLMKALSDDVPIMDVTQMILIQGFRQGLWNADLMLMLVEPTAYMILALAERAEIPVIIYKGELDDEDEEEEILGVSFQEDRIREMMRVSETGNIPRSIVSDEMREDLESLPTKESILAAPEPQAEAAPEASAAPQQESLMAPPQV